MEIRFYDPNTCGSWSRLFKYCFLVNGLAKPLDCRQPELYTETKSSTAKTKLIYQE